jgi:hypothetical protein
MKSYYNKRNVDCVLDQFKVWIEFRESAHDYVFQTK